MPKRIFLILLLLPLLFSLQAQNTLSINGLNEAELIYRVAEDSLNVYFKDAFAFNLGYRGFRFGMKFIGELPKYSNQESELMAELDANRLDLAWKELYAGFYKDAFSLHAGTTEESFGQGLSFRSFEDTELDEDHRLDSFLIKYEDELRFKTFYGAIENPAYKGRQDLAFGADAEYPVWGSLRLGASAVAYRDLKALGRYSYRDVLGGRAAFSGNSLDVYLEYLNSQRYFPGEAKKGGAALYANLDYLIGIFQLGGAYKKYEDFNYRLNDLPMANHHDESLSDALAGGMDEAGWQARFTVYPGAGTALSANYAEAWDSSKDLRMNDLYLEASLQSNADWTLSYSQIEKVDDKTQNWQKEYYPALSVTFDAFRKPLKLTGEFKTVEKESLNKESRHYEPKLLADLGLGKLGLALMLSSHWDAFDKIASSSYSPGIELKYPLFAHSDIILFAGREAGGKVCRNGSCRFVAPFEGVKMEFISRF